MTPTHTELCYLTIREAGQFLKRRELSPVELTRAFLDRIEALDSKLQAFITVLPQRAMAAARTAEAEMLRGDYRGPLHGIPIALKDLYDKIRGISRISPVALAAVLAPQWQRGSVWVRWGPVRVARSVGQRPIAAWWG